MKLTRLTSLAAGSMALALVASARAIEPAARLVRRVSFM